MDPCSSGLSDSDWLLPSTQNRLKHLNQFEEIQELLTVVELSIQELSIFIQYYIVYIFSLMQPYLQLLFLYQIDSSQLKVVELSSSRWQLFDYTIHLLFPFKIIYVSEIC